MVARRKGGLVVDDGSALRLDIISYYEKLLRDTAPPDDLRWEPVKIGPTWQWAEGVGWELPARSLGWECLAWCGEWLRGPNGGPWRFTAEQARFVLWYYALDEDGRFSFGTAVLQRLKGWGKDPLAACLALFAMFGDVVFDHWDGGRPVGRDDTAAWVQLIAVSQKQTQNTMKMFPILCTPEVIARYGIQIGKQNVWGLKDSRQIEAVTASVMAIEGGRPTQVIKNETQNWVSGNQGHDMSGAIEGNVAKSANGRARQLDICNAYRPGEDSVAQRTREAYDQVVAGAADDAGVLYDSLEAPPEAPLTAEAAPEVVRAVRGDAVWLDLKSVTRSVVRTDNPPSESRRKWYNQITAAEDAWMNPLKWGACAVKGEPVADGERIVMFFDGSKSDDASALIGCRVSDGLVFQIGVWQPNTREPIVDRAAVDLKVRACFDTYKVVGFWADPSDARDDETGELFWEPYIDRWANDFGKKLHKLPAVKTGFGQHPVKWDMRNLLHQKEFVEAAMRFTTDVANGELSQDGSELLRQHVENAKRRPGKFGVGLGKKHRESAAKVDAAVCAVGARLMWYRLTKGKVGTGSARKGRVVAMY